MRVRRPERTALGIGVCAVAERIRNGSWFTSDYEGYIAVVCRMRDPIRSSIKEHRRVWIRDDRMAPTIDGIATA